jgi:citronellol/citronellal dehydrogenase
VTVTDVLHLLRPGLLEGRTVALAGPARPQVAAALEALGAATPALDADLADEAATDAAAAGLAGADALVVDAAARFAGTDAGADELAPLRAAADGAWAATRAVANAVWIAPQRPGKLVVLAPPPGAGPHAEAARAALENLSRTLSIEWARFQIRTTTITPGAATTPETVAALTAYLVSPAGDYFSGARLDLS